MTLIVPPERQDFVLRGVGIGQGETGSLRRQSGSMARCAECKNLGAAGNVEKHATVDNLDLNIPRDCERSAIEHLIPPPHKGGRVFWLLYVRVVDFCVSWLVGGRINGAFSLCERPPYPATDGAINAFELCAVIARARLAA